MSTRRLAILAALLLLFGAGMIVGVHKSEYCAETMLYLRCEDDSQGPNCERYPEGLAYKPGCSYLNLGGYAFAFAGLASLGLVAAFVLPRRLG